MQAAAALFTAGRFADAAALAQAMAARFPLHGFGWKVWGAALKQSGAGSEAVGPMRKAVELSPHDVEARNNLGMTLAELGRLDEAAASFREVLQLTPDLAEAHYNLGIILNRLGQPNEASASFRRALQFRPGFAEAHFNDGISLHTLGRLDEAAASYRRALQIKPDFVEALNELAALFHQQGKSDLAIDTIKRSLRIKGTGRAGHIFVACVKAHRFTRDDSEIRAAMARALTEPWGRPTELAAAGIELIKLNPDLGAGIARAAAAWPRRLPAEELFGAHGVAAAVADPLLCVLLESAPCCDLAMEHFLTMARRAMLETAASTPAAVREAGVGLRFYGALARQCFLNEYVFAATDEEVEKATALRESLAAALEARQPVPAIWPAAVAAYFPLCSLTFAQRLLEQQWPGEVMAVLEQQLREPAEERRLDESLPRLTDIEDEVSLLVQRQYEDNPYPRWTKAAPARDTWHVVGFLRQAFPLVTIKDPAPRGSFDILIAGCGTGQQSIDTARYFPGARILAVDLSRRSLNFARRKTRELGLASIEYAQADLLNLGSLGRTFDMIESSGVLHHLADPLKGWRGLLSLLRPAGFMRLGFYSAVARRNIAKVRAIIAERGYGASADGIRRCRQDLIELEKTVDLGTTLRLSDFYTISTCRDLLFHVQEHRLTLPAIADFVRENNLTFLGFELGDELLRAYKARFPGDHAARDLRQWHIFEAENPDTFLAMYNFWLQKD